MIADHEPPVWVTDNIDGPAPVLVACDHAENRVPEALGDLGLAPEHFGRHIAYDIGARQVALRLSSMFDAPLILASYSRLVVDLNRHLDDPTLIPEVSDGVPVPGNTGLDAQQRLARLDTFFHPYHQAYREMIDRLLARYPQPIIISVHSFTPTMNGHLRPWHYGILYDHDEALAHRLIDNLGTDAHRPIGRNQPYAANAPRGYAQEIHARDRGVEMALIEIRQDLVESEAGQADAADVIYNAVMPILEERGPGDARRQAS